MAKTKIEWATHTWNPITGCTPVSEGCQNCYAKHMAKRLAGRAGYPKDDPFKITLHLNKLDEPFRWQKPRNVFVVSMGDLFHEDVDEKYIAKVLGIIGLAPKHTFMILTKRPDRMKELFDDEDFVFHIGWFQSQAVREFDLRIILDELKPWPFKNLWLGVTAENQQRADERIPILLQIPAAVRFVSVEPMLEPVDIERYLLSCLDCGNSGSSAWDTRPGISPRLCMDACIKHGEGPSIDWVICGGESGPNARPMHIDWARNLRDQCQTAGVPFFFKQMRINGKMVKMPELDGQVWDQFPEKGVII